MILICKCNHGDFKFYVFSSNFIVHIAALKMDWFRKASAWINILSYFLFCLVYYLKVWNIFNFCNLNKKKLYYLSILQFLNWVKLKIKFSSFSSFFFLVSHGVIGTTIKHVPLIVSTTVAADWSLTMFWCLYC